MTTHDLEAELLLTVQCRLADENEDEDEEIDDEDVDDGWDDGEVIPGSGPGAPDDDDADEDE